MPPDLSRAAGSTADGQAFLQPAIERGLAWLDEATQGGTRFTCSAIGLYFAKLWYFERLYPMIFTVAALESLRDEYGQP